MSRFNANDTLMGQDGGIAHDNSNSLNDEIVSFDKGIDTFSNTKMKYAPTKRRMKSMN